MKKEKINIGNIISNYIEEIGISKAELARRIGSSRQNVINHLNKPSLDSDLLFRYSKALNYDFFKYYKIDKTQEFVDKPSKRKFEVTIQIKINNEEKEKEILKMVLGNEIINLLK